MHIHAGDYRITQSNEQGIKYAGTMSVTEQSRNVRSPCDDLCRNWLSGGMGRLLLSWACPLSTHFLVPTLVKNEPC